MEKFHHIETQTRYSNDNLSMRLEEESSKPDIDLSKTPTSERDAEVNRKAAMKSEDISVFEKVC